MNKILTFTIMLLSALLAQAASPLAEADSAYSQKRYQEALLTYDKMAKANGTSADLFYNIGCVYFRLGEYPKAIVYFERALAINPTHTDARANLEFTLDKAKVPEPAQPFFSQLFAGITQLLTSNGWAIVALLAFLLTLGAIAVYIFTTAVAWRKTGFFGSFALLAVCIFAVVCAFYLGNKATSHNEAIVMTDSTLSTAPHQPSSREEAFALKAGEKVVIEDSVKTGENNVWLKVTAPDSRQAFIPSTNIERI